MEKYTLSLAGSSASLKWKAVRLTWDDFVKRLGTPVITNETMREYDRLDKPAKSSLKDVGGFMAGELSGAQRLKKAVMSRSMITLDVDFGDDLFPFDFADRFPGVAAAIYTTRSDHPIKSRRVVVLCDLHSQPGKAYLRSFL
jgi:putative DNA primase/helicase